MSLNIVDQEVRKVDSSQDLLLCVENLEGKEQKPSVFETAALQLTMHQIGTGWKVLSRENYRENDDILLYLATESIKETVSKGWKKFVEAFKAFLKKIKEKISQLIKKIKSIFSGKGTTNGSSAGTGNNKVEEVDEEGNEVKRDKNGNLIGYQNEDDQETDTSFTEEEESDLVKKLNSGKVSKQQREEYKGPKALPSPGKSVGSKEVTRTPGNRPVYSENSMYEDINSNKNNKFGKRYFRVKGSHFSCGDETGVPAMFSLFTVLSKIQDIRKQTQENILDQRIASLITMTDDGKWTDTLSELSDKNISLFKTLGRVEEKGDEYIFRISTFLSIGITKFDPAIGKVSFPRFLKSSDERIIIALDNVADVQKLREISSDWAIDMDRSENFIKKQDVMEKLLSVDASEIQQERVRRLSAAVHSLNVFGMYILEVIETFSNFYQLARINPNDTGF